MKSWKMIQCFEVKVVSTDLYFIFDTQAAPYFFFRRRSLAETRLMTTEIIKKMPARIINPILTSSCNDVYLIKNARAIEIIKDTSATISFGENPI